MARGDSRSTRRSRPRWASRRWPARRTRALPPPSASSPSSARGCSPIRGTRWRHSTTRLSWRSRAQPPTCRGSARPRRSRASRRDSDCERPTVTVPWSAPAAGGGDHRGEAEGASAAVPRTAPPAPGGGERRDEGGASTAGRSGRKGAARRRRRRRRDLLLLEPREPARRARLEARPGDVLRRGLRRARCLRARGALRRIHPARARAALEHLAVQRGVGAVAEGALPVPHRAARRRPRRHEDVAVRAFDVVGHDIGRYLSARADRQINDRIRGLHPQMGTVVNMDGRLVRPEEAVVSVFDRGFLYGDSVYEVVRTYGQRAFELERHLRRTLEAAAAAVEAPDPEAAPWNQGELSLRVIMTRGAGELGLDPALAVGPRAIIVASPLRGPAASAYRDGVSCRIVGVRHDAPEAPDTTAKTGAHLANVLAVREARAAGAHEALLLDRDGFVTEGASSNVFAVRAGCLETPPLEVGILAGVTRERVLELARAERIETRERRLRPEDLARAEELFITSTAREILPVSALDGRPVGTGRVGALTTRLRTLFRAGADAEAGAR